ncbi:hypothetical protein [Methanosarcina sp. MSH10X1]|nr:hypothetical protein [Methanosarcina sp. MSH10X1]
MGDPGPGESTAAAYLSRPVNKKEFTDYFTSSREEIKIMSKTH